MAQVARWVSGCELSFAQTSTWAGSHLPAGLACFPMLGLWLALALCLWAICCTSKSCTAAAAAAPLSDQSVHIASSPTATASTFSTCAAVDSSPYLTVRLMAADLAGTYSNGSRVAQWGIFNQSAVAYRPIFIDNSGNSDTPNYFVENAGYSMQFLEGPSISLKALTNGGFTIAAYLRIGPIVTTGGFNLFQGAPYKIMLSGAYSTIYCQVANDEGHSFTYDQVYLGDQIYGEWFSFILVYFNTGNSIQVSKYVNGLLRGVDVFELTMSDFTVHQSFLFNYLPSNVINPMMALSAFYIFDYPHSVESVIQLHTCMVGNSDAAPEVPTLRQPGNGSTLLPIGFTIGAIFGLTALSFLLSLLFCSGPLFLPEETSGSDKQAICTQLVSGIEMKPSGTVDP